MSINVHWTVPLRDRSVMAVHETDLPLAFLDSIRCLFLILVSNAIDIIGQYSAVSCSVLHELVSQLIATIASDDFW